MTDAAMTGSNKLARDEQYNEVLNLLKRNLGLDTSTGSRGDSLTSSTALAQIGRPGPALNSEQTSEAFARDVAYQLELREASKESKEYDMLHTEPLLEEALMLLDRALSDRVAYAALGIEQLTFAYNVQEFCYLDEINIRKAEKKYYELDRDVLEQQKNAEEQHYNLQLHNKQLLDEALGLKSFQSEDSRVSGGTILGQNGGGFFGRIAGVAAASAALPFFDPAAPPPPRWSRDVVYRDWPSEKIQDAHAEAIAASAAKTSAKWNFDVARFGYQLAQNSSHFLELASYYRTAEINIKMAYEQPNVDFKRDQTLASRAVYDAKVKESLKLDSVLNYKARMGTIKQRFDVDCQNAYDRLVKVEEGIENVYGRSFSDELPKPSDPDVFDKALRFGRLAHNYLSRLARSDQNYVMAFSVRTQQSLEAFGAAINDGFKNMTWHINVREVDFPGQRFVRLRGLSAFVQDRKGKRVYSLIVRTPKDGVNRSGKLPKYFDQKRELWLGRVGRRTDVRDGDIVGVKSLHNCSPIGDWEIALHPNSIEQALHDGLDDVELDLFLAVQPT